MTNTTAVSDLTTRVPWGATEHRVDVSAASFDVAVPSGNLGAEPQRLDATKAEITARLIRRYVDRQKELASLKYRGVRQDIEPISRGPTNEKRDGYWTAPVVRPVNWT